MKEINRWGDVCDERTDFKERGWNVSGKKTSMGRVGRVAGSGNSKPLVQPVFVHVLSAAPISRQVNCRGGDYFRKQHKNNY